MAENGKGKKRFITEKVVGRPITGKHAAKCLLLSVLCGLLFGAAAVFAMRYIPGPGSEEQKGDVVENTDISGNEAETEEAPEETLKGTLEVETEETEPIEDIVRTEVENHEYSSRDFESIIANISAITSEIGKSTVTVRSVSSDRGWFNDPIDTVDNYAGIVLSKAGETADILTTESAVINADSLEIVFPNETVAPAHIVGTSHYDNLSVIRVEGSEMAEGALEGVEPVKQGNVSVARPGDFVIAAGAPFGMTESYDFSFINYVYEEAPVPDREIKKMYVDISSDTRLGTFIFDDSGKFIGYAQPADDSAGFGSAVASAADYLDVIEKLSEGSSVPFIGIEGRDVSSEMQMSGMPVGVYVTGVMTDSPAYAAGIRRGDVITAVGATECSTVSGYSAALSNLACESPVRLTVWRAGVGNEYTRMEFDMVVGSR